MASDSSYSITTVPHRKLVVMKIVGMLTREQVEQLYREEHAAIAAMGCRLGEQICLVDLTDCKLQVQDVAAAFKEKQGDARIMARRLALYTGSSLARMQARRITDRANAELFETREQAEAWLFADEARAAA